jgi:ssDNA-specific exonuclease RecJ
MKLTLSDTIQLSIAVATFLAVIVALTIEVFRRISENKNKNKHLKNIFKALETEIKEGLERSEALIKLAQNGKLSFSRIYVVLWDSTRHEICQNIKNFEILQCLHKIYYRFDLINFNMECNRLAVGASFAKEYIDEMKKNFKKFQNFINENKT